jgi:uncharacterized membrane protein YqiK
MTGTDIITAILLAGIFIAIVVYLLYWLYRRSSKDVAFVRTGLGGEKVVISGGALVLPIVHNITPVGMKTLRLEVKRGGERAIITKNRMRVEVTAEFNLRVKPDPQAVSLAAQTLANRTMDPEQLKELVQGRFVDALSAVAAQMTMDEMQNKRGEYVRAVKTLVEEALTRNGLELEAVSLTGLDQVDIALFNPSNAFDAEGLTQLTEQIESRKKVRNDIEQDTLIQIKAKNLQSEIEALDIEKRSEYARLAQEREISKQRAHEKAAVTIDRAERDREAQEAEIAAEEEIGKARIRKEKALEAERSLRETTLTEEIEARRKHRNDVERDVEIAILSKNLEAELRAIDIEREKQFARLQQQEDIMTRRAAQTAAIAEREATSEREAEIARIKTLEAVELARIGQEKAVDAERIFHRRETERLEVERRMLIETLERERMIAILKKELEKALAEAETEAARAKLAEAIEKVVSVREREIAERRKQIELLEAARVSEAEALQITTIAHAQTEAAEQKAEAERFSSLAAKLRYEVDAEGHRMLNEAENMRSAENRADALRIKLVEHLESIIRESVKPMEQISDIKILQVEGMPGLTGGGTGGAPGGGGSDLERMPPGGGSLADNIVSSALRYRVQAPFVDTLLKEIGMSSAEMTRIKDLLQTDSTKEG